MYFCVLVPRGWNSNSNWIWTGLFLSHAFNQHRLQKETNEDFSKYKLWKANSLSSRHGFLAIKHHLGCENNIFSVSVILVCLEFSMKIIWSVENIHALCTLRPEEHNFCLHNRRLNYQTFPDKCTSLLDFGFILARVWQCCQCCMAGV